jgi:uncharacterized protein YdeI (YjbR/CyaY-like superfamily)
MSEPQYFETPAAFRGWLEMNATTARELLVGYYKTSAGQPSMSWPESVDQALCFGWIDGVRRRIDEVRYCIRFTPRKPGSIWSAVNLKKFAALDAAGQMTPLGRAAFAQRREERTAIYAYEQPQTASLSAVERRMFMDQPTAWAYYQTTPPSYQKVLMHWITTAKRPETRASRLNKLIDACVAGVRLR